MDGQFSPFAALASGASVEAATPSRPGSSASANPTPKQIGFLAIWAASGPAVVRVAGSRREKVSTLPLLQPTERISGWVSAK